MPKVRQVRYFDIAFHSNRKIVNHLPPLLNNSNRTELIKPRIMSATAGRMAGKVGQAAGKLASKANEAGSGKGKDSALQKGAKRDPELYVRRDPSVIH